MREENEDERETKEKIRVKLGKQVKEENEEEGEVKETLVITLISSC